MKNRVREFREGIGWSQKQLGTAIKVTQAIISKIESGQQPMTDAQMSQLAKVLETHPADLIDEPEWNSLPLSRLDEALLRHICKSVMKYMKHHKGVDEDVAAEVITSLYRRYAARASEGKEQNRNVDDATEILIGHEMAKRS